MAPENDVHYCRVVRPESTSASQTPAGSPRAIRAAARGLLGVLAFASPATLGKSGVLAALDRRTD